jgi:thymidylate synthase (FAD)
MTNKKTEIVGVTHPNVKKENGEFLTPEEFIVYIARVSNPNNQVNTETAPRLLNYLIKHKHWSPFEHVHITFEIKTSRAIAAQILRHRSFTFQEFSQRYASATTLEDIEWRLQGKTNRQAGEETVELEKCTSIRIKNILNKVMKEYDKLIKEGVAKECARMILPLCTSTTIYMTGSLRSWIHYMDIRMKKDTQKEHRIIAEEIYNTLKDIFPNVFFDNQGVY